jgi:choline monooxygenase
VAPDGSVEAEPASSRDFDIEAHWALYVENYLEGFHIPFVHAGLNQVVDYGSYSSELFGYSNLQVALAKPGESAFDVPAASPTMAGRSPRITGGSFRTSC